MEKKKHRSTKKAKEKAGTKADTKSVEAPSIQPDHNVGNPGSGLTDALRHQDGED